MGVHNANSMQFPCRSYNIDVLTACVFVHVHMKEQRWVRLCQSNPQQDMEARGLTSLPPAKETPIMASTCLLTHFHPSTDSV